VWLAADHTKFGRNALARVAHLAEIDALFTDREPPPQLLAALTEAGTELHVAPPLR